MKTDGYALTRWACYGGYVSMAAVSSISPLLFITFREAYGCTYTMLGLLVVVNFFIQLAIDLIFTVFSKYFDIKLIAKLNPLITAAGLVIYAVMPNIFPGSAYFWVMTGTAVFSVACGLSEVLLSPIIAAIPSERPEYEMSKLHSVFAWGCVAIVIFSTVFLKIFGRDSWMYLVLIIAIIPIIDSLMFARCRFPDMTVGINEGENKKGVKTGIMLCVICIFLGGAAECGMSQWMSGYGEKALGIPKVWGDIFGMAGFALLLGLGRTIYGKYGKNIARTMLIGMSAALACYIVAAVSTNPTVGLAACTATGLFTSMLWPGMLIYFGEKFPGAGVNIYALMAAGGDMGAAVGPQLVGIVSDTFPLISAAEKLTAFFGVSAEQIGMRAGILSGAIFPIAGIIVMAFMVRYFNKHSTEVKK